MTLLADLSPMPADLFRTMFLYGLCCSGIVVLKPVVVTMPEFRGSWQKCKKYKACFGVGKIIIVLK